MRQDGGVSGFGGGDGSGERRGGDTAGGRGRTRVEESSGPADTIATLETTRQVSIITGS